MNSGSITFICGVTLLTLSGAAYAHPTPDSTMQATKQDTIFQRYDASNLWGLETQLGRTPAQGEDITEDVAEDVSEEFGKDVSSDGSDSSDGYDNNDNDDAIPDPNPENVPTTVNNEEDSQEKKASSFEFHGDITLISSQAVKPHYELKLPSEPLNPIKPGLISDNENSADICMSMRYVGPISADFEAEYDSTSGTIGVKQYFLSYKPTTKTRLSLGQFKAPFGHEGFQSDSKIMTISRSQATKSLYHNRDLGLCFEYISPGDQRYYIAVMNGQGKNKDDINGGKDLFLRFQTPIAEHSTLGCSAHLGTYRLKTPLSSEDVPVRQYGIYYLFNHERWRVDAELIYSDGYNKVQKSDCQAWGGSLGCAYALDPRWDVTLFFDWFDPSLHDSSKMLYNDKINMETRWVLGATYYLDRRQEHKISLNYEIHNQTEGPRKTYSGAYLMYFFKW